MVYNEMGETYEGGWTNDLKEGEGIYDFKNGDKFIGIFNFSSYKLLQTLKTFNFF